MQSGRDANGFYVDYKLRPGTSVKDVYQFLENFDVDCVTVQPGDLSAMVGKNPISLGVERSLKLQGVEQTGLLLLEPDELADALQKAQLQALTFAPTEEGEAIESIITEDLVATGHLSQDEVNTVDQWLEAPVEEPGLRVGSEKRYDDRDMGEFTPEFSEDWGEL